MFDVRSVCITPPPPSHRLFHLMGYRREDLRDKLAFDFHHHDDTEATLECSRGSESSLIFYIVHVHVLFFA